MTAAVCVAAPRRAVIDDQVKKLPTGVELVETAVRAVQSELKNVDAMVAELAKGQDQVLKQMKDARQMIDGVEKVNKIIEVHCMEPPQHASGQPSRFS